MGGVSPGERGGRKPGRWWAEFHNVTFQNVEWELVGGDKKDRDPKVRLILPRSHTIPNRHEKGEIKISKYTIMSSHHFQPDLNPVLVKR